MRLTPSLCVCVWCLSVLVCARHAKTAALDEVSASVSSVDYVNGMGTVLPDSAGEVLPSQLPAALETMSNPLDLRNLQPRDISDGIVSFLGLAADVGIVDDGESALDQAPTLASHPNSSNSTNDSSSSSSNSSSSNVSNSSDCPAEFPYPSHATGTSGIAWNGRKCYNSKDYADQGSGPCDSWCTNDQSMDDGCNGCCGDYAEKACSGVQNDTKISKPPHNETAFAAVDVFSHTETVTEAVPMPAPSAGKGKRRMPNIKLGKMSFTAEAVHSNVLHANLHLSGRDIHGQTLKLDSHAHISGSVHLHGNGSLLKSNVTGKLLRATLFVNKENVQSCGVAIGNQGGFFDHQDGSITYEPLDGAAGFRVNTTLTTKGALIADGGIQVGGEGTRWVSQQTKREVRTLLHPSENVTKGAGIAVSHAGGFFDFKDGSITYEPLEGARGLQVNSDFAVARNATFDGNVQIRGTLSVAGGINFGNMEKFDAAFQHSAANAKKNDQLEARVKELETQNQALTKRMEEMEVAMQGLVSRR